MTRSKLLSGYGIRSQSKTWKSKRDVFTFAWMARRVSRSIPSEISERTTWSCFGIFSLFSSHKEPSPQPISRTVECSAMWHWSKIQGNQPCVFVLYLLWSWIRAEILDAFWYWFFILFSIPVRWISLSIWLQFTLCSSSIALEVSWIARSTSWSCSILSWTSFLCNFKASAIKW